jgi:HK97 family phage prohead protease
MADDIQTPREDLIRMETGQFEYRADSDGNGTLFGYAAVFDVWTEIDSWEGKFKERLAPGTFKKTLRERRDKIKVLFNHGMDPQIGNKPLGKPKVMREDDKGLYVEVPLDDTTYNRDIKALLDSGALDGMSFRMSVVDEVWEYPEKGDPERTIRAVKLYEFGPVTFPAYEATQAGVRAHAPAAFDAWRTAHQKQAEAPQQPTAPTLDLSSDDVAARLAAGIATALREALNPNPAPADPLAATPEAAPPPPTPDKVDEAGEVPPPSAEDRDGATETTPEDDATRAASGEQDPAPATDGHADTDEPPGGHSSPTGAADRRARQAQMAYVRQMAKHADERRSLFERQVLAYEADQDTPEGDEN